MISRIFDRVRTRRVKISPLAAGCMALFSLPFVGAGVFFGYLTYSTLGEAGAMKSWVETPAAVTAADLNTHRSTSGGKTSITHSVTAEYRYEYGGREYTGNRVSIHPGGDNIGNFHKDIYAELASHRQSGEPFRCFVNPENPSESVLYRDIRWGLTLFYAMFGLVFLASGAFVLVGVYVFRKKRARIERMALEHPGSPWMIREEWASNRLVSSNRQTLRAASIMALLWNAISWPVGYFILEDLRRGGNWTLAVFAVFPLIGIALAGWALREWIRWRKYGESVLVLDPFPARLGGRLAGAVHTRANVTAERGFHLALRCVRQYTTGSGKNRSTREEVLWEARSEIMREARARDFTRSEIPVDFAIPDNLPPSDPGLSSNRILWRLEASAETPGVDYYDQFEIPVFAPDGNGAETAADGAN